MDSPQYELLVFDFTISNPFPAECDFSVRLVHERAEPLPKPAEARSANASRPVSQAGSSKGAARLLCLASHCKMHFFACICKRQPARWPRRQQQIRGKAAVLHCAFAVAAAQSCACPLMHTLLPLRALLRFALF